MQRNARLLAILALISVMMATMYGMVQQSIRLSAYDAPRQAIEAYVANRNASESNFTHINLTADSNVFIIVYDGHGKPVAGDGYLGNKLAVVPFGVLQHARAGRENTVTWQPQAGVRLATVVAKDGAQYILAGQSLKSYEDRTARISRIAALGWVLAVMSSIVGFGPKYRS